MTTPPRVLKIQPFQEKFMNKNFMSNTRNDVDWLINRFFGPGRSVKHAASSLEYKVWQQLGPSGHT